MTQPAFSGLPDPGQRPVPRLNGAAPYLPERAPESGQPSDNSPYTPVGFHPIAWVPGKRGNNETMKRVLSALAWTAGGAYVGGGVLLGFLFITLFCFSALFQYDPSVHSTLFAGISQLVRLAVALCFLVLAICRRLPWTK